MIIAVILGIALWAALRPGPRPGASPVAVVESVPRIFPSTIPLVSGEEPEPQLFSKAGCVVCHTIPGIEGATGQVGPPLVLGTTGTERLSDPLYQGAASTVKEYIVESILMPRAYVVPGYPDRTMPPWYGEKLSALALERMAKYLERVTEDTPFHPSQPTR